MEHAKIQAWRNRISDGREPERNIVPTMAVQDNAVYGKVPCFIHICREGKSERMSCRLITPKKVRQLQNKLYLTAKKCDSRRFHALYDKVYRDDVLFEAWKRVKANKGSSGADGTGIEDIEAVGIEKYLTDIKTELADGKDKPSPVKRVMIPKPDGSESPLGIPAVRDRIVQMAAKIAIEPVFEAGFRDCSC